MNAPLLATLAIAALVAPAGAAFHLFEIREVYSNSDGSVQFIELYTSFGTQQFLEGHTIGYEINSAVQESINLLNLPGDTTDKAFLAATSNFSALYGITPDFIIPANFFAAGSNGFIDFAEGIDRVNLTNLPTNGFSSLNGIVGNTGQTAADTSVNTFATPMNFAGQTTTIPESSALGLAALGAGLLGRRKRRG